MNYEYLKEAIVDAIKENHRQEITGDLLQQILLGMVDNMTTYRYMGIATTETHPVGTDSNIMFVASESGTYTYMGGLTVGADEFAILKRDTEWHKDSIPYSGGGGGTPVWGEIEGNINDQTDLVAAFDLKQNAEEGKGLSTNDYTSAEKSKLNGISEGAEVNVINTIKVNNTALTPTNKAVNISVPTKTSDISNDSGFITNSALNGYATEDYVDDAVEGKQDTISDLATIRNNASAGKTASDNLGGHTVGKNVPSDAVFTDTVYDDTEVRGLISSETTRATDAEDEIAEDVAVIESKIPTQASSTNQLADKEFVNSSVATNTSNYISDDGEPFTSVSDLPTSGVTNNDYAFVTGTDTEGNTYYDRYKATVMNGNVSWAKEYRLNNSSFTAVQWAAITSGITAALVGKLNDLPTNSQLTTLLAGKADSDDIPTALAELTGDSTHRTVTDAEKSAWNSKSDFSGSYDDLEDKPTIPTQLSQLSGDSTHRTVTDSEKSTWNNKSDFSGDYEDLDNKPTIPSLDGYATEEYVDDAVEGKASNEDLTNLANDLLTFNIDGPTSLSGAGTYQYTANPNLPTQIARVRSYAWSVSGIGAVISGSSTGSTCSVVFSQWEGRVDDIAITCQITLDDSTIKTSVTHVARVNNSVFVMENTSNSPATVNFNRYGDAPTLDIYYAFVDDFETDEPQFTHVIKDESYSLDIPAHKQLVMYSDAMGQWAYGDGAYLNINFVNKSIIFNGNIMALINTNTMASYCFAKLFNGCTSLVNAPELPATSLGSDCYNAMFDGCTSLVNAPELPATSLAIGCYSNMFNGCTSLVNAPELPATSLVDYCYYLMFNSCTSLNYVKCLATDVSAPAAIAEWLKNVSPTGTFVKKQGVTYPSGASGIPDGWTVEDIVE